MILRLDDEYNIIEAITVGGDPNAEGFCEVLTVPPDVLGDIFSYKYIDGQFVRRDNVDDSLLQEVRSIKIEFLNKTCHTLIEGGIDVGDDHYSLTSEDQINLSKLTTQAALMPNVPIFYHADGQLCRQYTPEEMIMIATLCVGWVTYHTTYFNYAKAYIESLTDFDTIASFKYGSQIADQSLYEQMTVITSTTQVVFDNEIDDPFDYDTLKNPMADFFQDPGEEEEIFIPQTIFDDPGDEYVEEVPTYEEEPVYEEPVQESDL